MQIEAHGPNGTTEILDVPDLSEETKAELDALDAWIKEKQAQYPKVHLSWNRRAAEEMAALHGTDAFDAIKEGLNQCIAFEQTERNQS